MKRKNKLLYLNNPNFLFFLTYYFINMQVNAQSMKGVTNKPDTSYTTYSAYKYTKQDYPNITTIQEFHYADVVERKGITYCTLGQRNLLIDAFMPKIENNKKRIAVIMIHGGGWRTGNRSQHYPLAESLAHLGYVCFTPEYRLSTEALFPAAIYDIKAAIRWVRANASTYGIDPSKIAVAGFSSGGELAAFMATTANMPLFEGCNGNTNTPSCVNALIDIDGTLSFVNAESGEGDDSKGISAATYWLGYPKKGNKVLWEAASPLSYVNAQTPPTLFLNSSLPRMHAGRQDYVHILDSNHIYFEVHEFKNSPHSFCLFTPWFEPTLIYIDKFLKKVFMKENG